MDLDFSWISALQRWIWGPPLLVFLAVAGIYLTYVLKGVQFRYLFSSLRLFLKDEKRAKGDISHVQALMVSLAAMIGIGSIAGVATAIAIGGFGAVFWMWVAAILGMAIKYAESVMAIRFRVFDSKGQACGGPMYYLSRGAGWKIVAVLYAIFGTISGVTSGNMPQSNAVAESVYNLWGINPLYTGILLAILTGFVIMGGVKMLGRVCSFLVPFMALFYITGGAIVLFIFRDQLGSALNLLFQSAFTMQAPIGGFAGATVLMAVRLGVARGIFANEAGLGTSSIAASSAQTTHPHIQGVLSMAGVFCTTIVCTFTALVIAVSGVLGEVDKSGTPLSGVSLVMEAFSRAFPGGSSVVALGGFFFGYSTILGWAFYGERCCEYLFGEKSVKYYRVFYILMILVGANMALSLVWDLADIINAGMTLFNIIGLIGLTRYLKHGEMEA